MSNNKRIYDDPNHPHYGPIRRAWVIFSGLNLLDTFDLVYLKPTWDETISEKIKLGYKEDYTINSILANYYRVFWK